MSDAGSRTRREERTPPRVQDLDDECSSMPLSNKINTPTDKPTIAYICTRFPAPSETFVYNEIIGLRARGCRVDVFSIHAPEPDRLSAAARALIDDTFYLLPLKTGRFLAAHCFYLVRKPLKYFFALFHFVVAKNIGDLRSLRRTFFHFLEAIYIAAESRERGISYLHAHFATGAASVAMFVSLMNDTPFGFTIHAMDLFRDKLLLPEKVQHARLIIPISRYNVRALVAECPGVDPAKFQIVHYGIDLNRFRPAAAHKASSVCLLSLGRLVEKKGFRYLIEAARILKDEGHRFRCVIVGEGPERPLLEQMIRERSMENDVLLVGDVLHECVYDFYAKADLFALPCVVDKANDRDGIPNVLIEAMAMELPCVSTTVSGIPELIDHGQDGLLVVPNDARALAAAVGTLIVDPPLRGRLGRAARIKVEREFNLDRSVERLEELFFNVRREPYL